ncbi:TPA: ABC-2 transporter permease, partial [Clostridioides difficile]|nr:ABC-2 transporter permease [Clostridioides difficile]
DEQNNWGLFRLTMPLSRRDVVLARYGVIVTLGLVGLAAGLVGAGLVTALATFVDLPMGLSAVLAYRFEDVLATLFSSFFCIFMGSFVAGVVTPLYFRFGQSKATQYLPLIMVLVFFVLPVSLIGNSGLLDGGIVGTDALTSLLAFIETPAGVAASMGVLLAASALVLAVSAAVSLRLYERREL